MGCISSKRARTTYGYTAQPKVTRALAHSGLETGNLIVGIDFTATNKWAGVKSFQGRSLHHIGDEQNPYEQAISIIGRTLSGFHDNNLIPCFGFGDGPTSFAPIIEMAITIVEQSECRYHVLVIIADGPVTANASLLFPSPQIKKTIDAIVKAREYPLSIIVVGVGDGPWNMMKNFLNDVRVHDSFKFRQFVNFTEIMSKNMDISREEAAFAIAALRRIPSQYKSTLNLKPRVPLSPPPTSEHPQPSSFHPGEPDFDGHNVTAETSQPASSTSDDNPPLVVE
ncbi:E3 ubiquitin-protein ligase RGLG1 [Camellia lanceoleosa]|uniref:E3 ubiquitin-protein ligase RGLG1 n=1 Tax=Camellia lanceoleosa TaxID=1840588 RepID=A0ACC0I4K2_9ERIC|nr:E3 ubiquitin-protein ligase RGLG1 [Camellia lanceoleosa]